MLYNTWEYNYDTQNNKHSFVLNASNQTDREERDEHLCAGGVAYAWVHFPRIDDATNKKYRELLKEYVEELINNEICHLENRQYSLRAQ